jgi:two-component sensor histidine kinase
VTNAVKHVHTIDEQRPVRVTFETNNDTAKLVIYNGPATLPEGFDFAAGRGLDIGLDLVRSLLPAMGAKLNFRQEGDGVIAELAMTTPMIKIDEPRDLLQDISPSLPSES